VLGEYGREEEKKPQKREGRRQWRYPRSSFLHLSHSIEASFPLTFHVLHSNARINRNKLFDFY